MSTSICPSCDTVHGPAQRYCLGCGALVGRRSVEIDQAIAYGREHAVAPVPVGEPADALPAATEPGVGVWRRPATSVAATLALVAGVAGGFLTAPQGGQAGSPVVLSREGGTPITPSPTESAPVEEAPIEDVPVEAVAPEEGAEPLPPLDETAPAAADAGPSLDDAPLPPVDAPPADPAPAATEAEPKTKAATKDEKPKKEQTAAEAAGLPKIDHVWVIGIGAPLTALEGDYAADVLLARGTELPEYTPVSTDPLLGAAALVAGRDPSPKTKTIATQLTDADRSWRAYAPGTPNCDAPGGVPLLSFPTVVSLPDCSDRVAGLDALAGDLDGADTAPAFTYVATDAALDPAGLEAQLRQVVEPIRRSAAFKRSGLIAIVPTAANPIAATGALVLSPFAEGSTSVAKAYGPYSLLRTFADLLAVDPPGEAAGKDVRGLGRDVLVPKD